jgi:predicted DNA-binding transcriptional regulator AlpA
MTTIKRQVRFRDPDELLDVRQLAQWLGVSVETIYDWIYKSVLPRPIKLGTGRSAPVRYRRRDIDRWLDSCDPSRSSSAPGHDGRHPSGQTSAR